MDIARFGAPNGFQTGQAGRPLDFPGVLTAAALALSGIANLLIPRRYLMGRGR